MLLNTVCVLCALVFVAFLCYLWKATPYFFRTYNPAVTKFYAERYPFVPFYLKAVCALCDLLLSTLANMVFTNLIRWSVVLRYSHIAPQLIWMC